MAFRPVVGVALLGATLSIPAHATEFRYVLGTDEADEAILGGGHRVIDFSHYREAMDSNNLATSIHPQLTGAYAKYDSTYSQGQSDWPVFASSWWPQSDNGVARRWTGGSLDYGVHTDKDKLSPAEKYDLLFHPGQERTIPSVTHWNYDELDKPLAERPAQHSHPAVNVMGPATEWEMENHGMYQTSSHPEGWWGHCNGWASYSTTEEGGAPQRDIHVKLVNGDVVECASGETGCVMFRMGDIEALMTELYFDDSSTFGGARCEQPGDEIERDAYGRPLDAECRDLNAGTFHIAITGLLGRGADHLGTGEAGHPAFVVDHNYDYEVWNFPVTRYEITATQSLTEAQAAAILGGGTEWKFNGAAVKFQRVAMTWYMVSDGVNNTEMLKRADTRNVALHPVDVHYILELDANNNILGGEWIQEPGTTWGDDSRTLHPDFLWMGSDHQGSYESSDDTGGSNDNPYLSYTDVRALLDCANDPATCSSSGTVDPGTGSDPGDDPVVTTPDCNSGCANQLAGPSPFASIGLGALGFALRRRRTILG